MFHTFRRIPVWEYQTDQQLLKGLLDALAAHKVLCDEGVLHGRINPETVFLVEAVAGSEQGAAGFLDATHIEEDVGAAGPSVVAVNDTDAGPLQCVSRRLLWHISHGRTPVQTTLADDMESFYWVLLYAVFGKLVASMAGVDRSRAEERLVRASFSKMFGGTSAEDILDGRASALWAIEDDNLFVREFAADRISHALRVLLWHYSTTHLRNTAVKSPRPRAQGIKDHMPRPSTEALAKVFNHEDMMRDLEVAAAGGLLGTDDSDMSVDG